MAVTDTNKDAAYVAIGLGVLGFQKAQVRRVELTKQIEDQFKGLEGQVAEGRKVAADLAAQLDDIVAPVRATIETQLDTIESVLPGSAAEIMKSARTAAHNTEATVRKTFGFAA